ncbi:MAG TPA: UDP-N-acetylglucosamine 2-epimerase (non-hydrolyzing) [Desulfobaccales bacterium]|jgi:UDP-N-acetylglucosamine 2-epimerase (non-hydrolysing)|nr:UDP-N-acetylglucosamine 2-epimerase (non-hydrolyzing) [Desulfobaccales bacterium]
MQKILSILGTRPEVIKMAPVLQELSHYQSEIISKVCVTAQHRQLVDQVLNLFQITPDYDLNIMKPDQSITSVAIAVLQALDPIFLKEKPDWVLVQGDTTTVMAATLGAFFRGIRVGHVEAGLRTYDKQQPFPEEINRRIASLTSDLHFAPTKWAADNLRQEGIPDAHITVTGNTVIDAIHQVAEMHFDPANTPLADLPLGKKKIILVTAHRREHYGQGIARICAALDEIAGSRDDIHLVYPVHPNPNIWQPVHRLLQDTPHLTLLPPLDYLPLVYLMKHSYLVLTDSGGIQEEAPGLGVPVLVLREVTERPEGVAAGTVRLVGTQREIIVQETRRLLEDEAAYKEMARAVNPYGDGHAAERIVRALLEYPTPRSRQN